MHIFLFLTLFSSFRELKLYPLSRPCFSPFPVFFPSLDLGSLFCPPGFAGDPPFQSEQNISFFGPLFLYAPSFDFFTLAPSFFAAWLRILFRSSLSIYEYSPFRRENAATRGFGRQFLTPLGVSVPSSSGVFFHLSPLFGVPSTIIMMDDDLRIDQVLGTALSGRFSSFDSLSFS